MHPDPVYLLYRPRDREEFLVAREMREDEAKECLRTIAAIGYAFVPVRGEANRYHKVKADYGMIARADPTYVVEYYGEGPA